MFFPKKLGKTSENPNIFHMKMWRFCYKLQMSFGQLFSCKEFSKRCFFPHSHKKCSESQTKMQIFFFGNPSKEFCYTFGFVPNIFSSHINILSYYHTFVTAISLSTPDCSDLSRLKLARLGCSDNAKKSRILPGFR